MAWKLIITLTKSRKTEAGKRHLFSLFSTSQQFAGGWDFRKTNPSALHKQQWVQRAQTVSMVMIFIRTMWIIPLPKMQKIPITRITNPLSYQIRPPPRLHHTCFLKVRHKFHTFHGHCDGGWNLVRHTVIPVACCSEAITKFQISPAGISGLMQLPCTDPLSKNHHLQYHAWSSANSSCDHIFAESEGRKPRVGRVCIQPFRLHLRHQFGGCTSPSPRNAASRRNRSLLATSPWKSCCMGSGVLMLSVSDTSWRAVSLNKAIHFWLVGSFESLFFSKQESLPISLCSDLQLSYAKARGASMPWTNCHLPLLVQYSVN